MHLKTLNILLTLSILAGVSCQTYDFAYIAPSSISQSRQETVIEAKKLKPNVMLVVDNSGSMKWRVDGTNATNGTGPIRVEELKTAMKQVLGSNGKKARFGLSIFPGVNNADLCQATTEADVLGKLPTGDDDTDGTLQSNSDKVNGLIDKLVPNGGTPTAPSLEFVGKISGLNNASDFRKDYVILLTDGLPNCNKANQAKICGVLDAAGMQAGDSAACKCTSSDCGKTYCTSPTTKPNLCNDSEAVVREVQNLFDRDIKTFVIGFSDELNNSVGADVLSRAARVGGLPRPCTTVADCGPNNRCEVGVCSTAFYQASNAAQLQAALAKFLDLIVDPVCEYKLTETPTDPSLLAVLVDGANVARSDNTWQYDLGTIFFKGDLCKRITDRGDKALKIEFRVVQRF